MTPFSQVHWIFDTYMMNRLVPGSNPNLMQAVQALGCPTQLVSYNQGAATTSPPVDCPNDSCVVAYGSHRMVRQVLGSREAGCAWQPGAFSMVEKLAYSASSPHLGELMLNDTYILLPLAEARRRGFQHFPNGYFLKPDSLIKSFTGLVIRPDNAEIEFKTIDSRSTAGPETICVLAAPAEITAEFRFVIADRQVVAGSQYSWDHVMDVRSDVLPECEALAQRVAELEWQPDRVYVCDVAMTPDRGPRVIELNTFSSSGLYACDTIAIARAVSKTAWKEYIGDD